jgi:hypothetical protein
VSRLVMAAFHALNGSSGPGYWHDLATVATVLRESGDPGVASLLEPPLGDREAWDRLVAVSEEAGAGGPVVLDLKTQYLNPDAHSDLRAGPEGEGVQ